MEPPGGRDSSRFNLGYSMNLLSGETAPEIYGNPNLGRPSTSLQQLSPRHTMVSSACGTRGLKSDLYDERGMSSQGMGLDTCGVNDISEDTYSSMQSKKSPPSNGKKTKGRVKIKMEYIENKLRRYTTFSKRKTGIMKKAYELSTLTGTQVMLLVASETGHVYTFATRKLQPMITSEAGKALIQTCLNSPDPPAGSAGGDQRMSATGFEETELTYNISDDDSKEDGEGEVSSSSEEDNSDLPEEMFPNPEITMLPPSSKEKLPRKETEKTRATNPNQEPKIPKTCLPIISSRAVNDERPQIPNASSNSPEENLSNTTNNPADNTSINPPLPFLVQPSGMNNLHFSFPQNALPINSSNSLQALPLLLQTPGGVGYASTSEGMILGLIQGQNVLQPQLVAIPLASVGNTIAQNIAKESENKTS